MVVVYLSPFTLFSLDTSEMDDHFSSIFIDAVENLHLPPYCLFIQIWKKFRFEKNKLPNGKT